MNTVLFTLLHQKAYWSFAISPISFLWRWKLPAGVKMGRQRGFLRCCGLLQRATASSVSQWDGGSVCACVCVCVWHCTDFSTLTAPAAILTLCHDSDSPAQAMLKMMGFSEAKNFRIGGQAHSRQDNWTSNAGEGQDVMGRLISSLLFIAKIHHVLKRFIYLYISLWWHFFPYQGRKGPPIKNYYYKEILVHSYDTLNFIPLELELL